MKGKYKAEIIVSKGAEKGIEGEKISKNASFILNSAYYYKQRKAALARRGIGEEKGNCWQCEHGKISDDGGEEGTAYAWCHLDGKCHDNDTCEKFVLKGSL